MINSNNNNHMIIFFLTLFITVLLLCEVSGFAAPVVDDVIGRQRRPTTTTITTMMTATTTSSFTNTDSNVDTALQSFYILRHGETDANAAGIIQGSSDRSRLTEKGKSQAMAFGLMALNPDTIKPINQVFVSPLTRAQDTLRIIREYVDPVDILPPPEKDTILHNLREIDFYSWENQCKKELQKLYPNEFEAWRKPNPDELIVDGKKPLHELWTRAENVWNEIRSYDKVQSIRHDYYNDDNSSPSTSGKLLVCHGTLGQALLATAFGEKSASIFRKHKFPNCGMAEIIWHKEHNIAMSWRWHNICDNGFTSEEAEVWNTNV